VNARWPRLGGAAVSVLVVASALGARAASFRATVNRTEIAAHQSVELVLTLTEDAATRPQPLSLPEWSGTWSVVRQDSRQSKAAGPRGRVRRTTTYVLELRPVRNGELVIGPARVRSGRQMLETRPIRIRVHDATVRGARRDGAADAVVAGAEEDVFLAAAAEPARPYLGQQVTVTYSVYASEAVHRGELVRKPVLDDEFWVESLDLTPAELEWTPASLHGRSFMTKALTRYAVFPVRAGRLALDALVFDFDVAPGYHSRAGLRTVRRESRPLVLEVRPLPAAGQPPDFPSGNVGVYRLQARLARTEVLAGEPVVLTVEVRGQGYVRLLSPPRVEVPPGARLLGPRSRTAPARRGLTVTGIRTWDYELVATRPGRLTIPSPMLPHFDPVAEMYRQARGPDLTLRVLPTGADTEARSHDALGAAADTPAPLRDGPPFRSCATPVYMAGWFHLGLVVPPLALAAVVLAGAVRRRVRARRRTTACRRQRAASDAERVLEAGASEPDLATPRAVRRALLAQLELRLGLDAAGRTREELDLAVRSAGLDDELAGELIALLARCDRAQYGARDATADTDLAQEARALLARLKARTQARAGEAT